MLAKLLVGRMILSEKSPTFPDHALAFGFLLRAGVAELVGLLLGGCRAPDAAGRSDAAVLDRNVLLVRPAGPVTDGPADTRTDRPTNGTANDSTRRTARGGSSGSAARLSGRYRGRQDQSGDKSKSTNTHRYLLMSPMARMRGQLPALQRVSA
jgi:hypothetical protein